MIIDDSVFERNRSKKVELLAKVYDHAKNKYTLGFRMLTLGWSDGSTFMPVNSVLLSSENRKAVINPSEQFDKRSNAYKRRKLSQTKATDVIITLLKEAKEACINANTFFLTAGSLLQIRFVKSNPLDMMLLQW